MMDLPWLGPLVLTAGLMLTTSGAGHAAAPLVDALNAAPATVAPGERVTVHVEAHDPDCPATCTTGCGTYIRSDLTTWSTGGGTIESEDNGLSASPYTASATWRAPATEGTYTISVSLSDSGGLFCGGRQTTTAELSVLVTTSTNAAPAVTSVRASPERVYTTQTAQLACAATEPDGEPLTFTWSTDLGTITPGASTGGSSTASLSSDRPGIALVTCTATDPGGARDSATLQLAVTDAVAERRLAEGLSVPHRLAVDELGDVYVVDRARSGIQVMSLASGEPVYRLELPGVTSIAVDWTGNLLAGFVDGARLLDRGGRSLLELDVEPRVGAVVDVAVDPVERRYVTLHRTSGRILVYDAAGDRLAGFGSVGDGPGELRSPSGLAVTPGGDIVVADSGHGLIRVFDPLTGTLERSFGGLGGGVGRFVRLDDVAVGPDGVVWASDSFQDWLQSFDPDGTPREVVGTYGGGVGELKTAAGVAISGSLERLLVASVNSGSVQVFRTSGAEIPGPTPTLAYTPDTLEFGPQPVGTTSALRRLAVRNLGTARLGIRSAEAGGEFTVVAGCPAFLEPGERCTVSVTFTPSAVGVRSGRLLLDTSDATANAGSPVEIALTGSGFVPGRVVVTPTALDFPDQPVGTVSEPLAVTLSNPGTTPVTLRRISVTSGPFGQTSPCPRVLAAGASCTVSVYFTPTGVGDHLRGSLSVATGSGTARIPIEGRAVAIEVTPQPGTIDFGIHRLDAPAESRVVTLGNTGTDFVEIFAATVRGDAPATFVVEEDLCTGRVLWLDETCTLSVAFVPERHGVLQGELEIVSTAALSHISLTGFGVDGSAPAIPTMGEWGLLGLALLVAGSGITMLGRRG